MAFIEFVYAAYIGVTITILIGIFVEGRRAQMDNVLSNITSFMLLLATTNMPLEVAFALLVYLGLGIFIVARKIKDLYLLFGAKSYGAIALVMLVAENQFFGYVPYVRFDDMRSLLIGCICMVLAVHIIGLFYAHRRKRGARRPSGARGGRRKSRAVSHEKGLFRRRH